MKEMQDVRGSRQRGFNTSQLEILRFDPALHIQVIRCPCPIENITFAATFVA